MIIPDRARLVRIGELRFRAFTGAPVVEISPEQWGLGPDDVRQAALSRRYRETPPDRAGFLRFEFAPGFFPPHFDRGPGTDADRRRLAKLLAGQPQFWASSRRLRLSRADIGAVAAAAGMTVAAEVADSTDRLLLLRGTGLPAEELRPRTIGRRPSLGQVQTLVAVACVAGIGVGMYFAAMAGNKWPLLFIVLSFAVMAGVVGLIRGIAGRSPRMPWLDAQFNGGHQVVVAPPPSVSTELLGEVASLYGYFYAGPYHSGRNAVNLLFAKCRPGLVVGAPAAASPH